MIIKAKTKQLIEQALKEDIGAGDITSHAVIIKSQRGKFLIVSNEPCIVCGMALVEGCFTIADKDVHPVRKDYSERIFSNGVHFRPMVNDGANIPKGKVIAHIEGRCYGILTAERTALNFLGWLSGISTLTNKFVDAVKDFKAQIMDTRKTTPTLRHLEKYAVKIGGGKNHRMGLYDQVLIKDNHISVAGSVREAIEKAKKYGPKNKKIEIETKSLREFREALALNPDIIMLDNMKLSDIKEAVKLRDSYRIKQQDVGFKTLLEVSGNINLDNVKEIASTGVDRISIGALTHSAPAIDFSLKAE